MIIGLLQLNSTIGDFSATGKNCWPVTKKPAPAARNSSWR